MSESTEPGEAEPAGISAANSKSKQGKGHDADDAADLVQGFFTRLIEKDDLARADAERGRFRSFLLGAFVHFAANEGWAHGEVDEATSVDVVDLEVWDAFTLFR